MVFHYGNTMAQVPTCSANAVGMGVIIPASFLWGVKYVILYVVQHNRPVSFLTVCDLNSLLWRRDFYFELLFWGNTDSSLFVCMEGITLPLGPFPGMYLKASNE